MYFFEQNEALASRPMLLGQEGEDYSYSQVWQLQDAMLDEVPGRSLVFVLCENRPVVVAAYLGLLRRGSVPLLLHAGLPQRSLKELQDTYHPSFLFLPRNRPEATQGEELWTDKTYSLISTGEASPALSPDLALLLSTSGSTGSPKLVRLSRDNLQANAQSIAEYLNLTCQERPITSLPMEYTYGLSVINSHVLAGAALLVTKHDLLEGEFWSFFQKRGGTSFAGVPYSYELLNRLRIMELDLPTLRQMTQAGGKLSLPLQEKFCALAERKGIRFTIMYGQTEATARMSYLPWEKCREKQGSIGIAIPGGRFAILTEEGETQEAGARGELVYYGPNVSLGYAQCAADLLLGDENQGRLLTGDLGYADAEGFYYVTGRRKRFLKVAGKRVSLDELEGLLSGWNPSLTYLCAGKDDCVKAYAIGLPEEQQNAQTAGQLKVFLGEATRLHDSVFHIGFLDRVPRSPSGKIAYEMLEGAELY